MGISSNIRVNRGGSVVIFGSKVRKTVSYVTSEIDFL